MQPADQPITKLDTSPGSRGIDPTSTEVEVNYAFRHRGTILMVAGQGVAVRMELYQRRGFEALSLHN